MQEREGCISFTELNKILPEDIKDPAAIEKVFNFLGAHSIEIVTQDGKDGEKRTLSGEVWKQPDAGDDGDLDEESSTSSQEDEAHDGEETTTTYLREMGRFDLLTPEEEAKYSKPLDRVLIQLSRQSELINPELKISNCSEPALL